MGYSVSILNNIRMNASEEYQNRIPEATRENLSVIGQAFEKYSLQFNEFHSALFMKIGKTIIDKKMWKNKLSFMKQGEVVSPHDVEEIFIEMAKAVHYDNKGQNPLGRRDQTPIHVAYHRKNREDCYEITVGDIDFAGVFRSEATLDNFIREKINSVYRGDQKDEWLLFKNMLATFSYKKEDGSTGTYFDYEISAMGEDKEKWAVEFIKGVRKAVQDAGFLSTQYNAAGVETSSDPSELILLVNKDVLVEVDVERLAKAFHTSETDLKVVPKIVSMDDFGSLGDTYALLVDKDFPKIWDTLVRMEPQRNAQGLFTNYFYHHHQIISASPFKTAIRFKKAAA